MKKTYTFAISFVLLCFVIECRSQEKLLPIPEKYKYPKENTNIYKTTLTVPGTYWVVYSDRNNNITYESPYSFKEKATVQFMDKLYVIDESDGYVHVIKDTDMDESGSIYEDCGWIDKQYLLLWEHCLYSDTKNVEKKAIIMNTLDYLKEDVINDGKDQLVYSDPDLKLKTSSSLEIFDFYFVYKITQNSVLLGNNIRISGKEAVKANIVGWVPKNRVVFWNTKVGIEPNWDNEAVKERKKNNTDCKIFADELSAELFRTKKGVNENYVIWDDDLGQKRNPGIWLRFQLLEKYNNIIKIGFQGQIISAIDSLGRIITVKNFKSDRVSFLPSNAYTYIRFFTNSKNLMKVYNYNYQVYLTGFAPYKISDCEYTQFKSSIMLSRLELGELINKLKQFYEPFIRSENVNNFQSKIKDLCKAEMPDKKDELIMSMKVGELLANIFYVSSNAKIDNCNLSDVILPEVISKEEFKNYCDKLTENLKELEKIYNDGEYEFMYYYKNKEYYYWISEDYLP